MNFPRVFLDTSALKAAADEIPVLVPRSSNMDFAGRPVKSPVYEPRVLYPNEKYLEEDNRDQYIDTLMLPILAAFARKQSISLLTHLEVEFESWGLPRMRSLKGRFYGTPIEFTSGPFEYSRVVLNARDATDYQYDFLRKVDHKRFLELQRGCGAFQGDDKPPHRNQLLDAWHLLCAESAKANYFLTLDRKLLRVLSTTARYEPRLAVITPLNLVSVLVEDNPALLCILVPETIRLAKERRENRRNPWKAVFG